MARLLVRLLSDQPDCAKVPLWKLGSTRLHDPTCRIGQQRAVHPLELSYATVALARVEMLEPSVATEHLLEPAGEDRSLNGARDALRGNVEPGSVLEQALESVLLERPSRVGVLPPLGELVRCLCKLSEELSRSGQRCAETWTEPTRHLLPDVALERLEGGLEPRS